MLRLLSLTAAIFAAKCNAIVFHSHSRSSCRGSNLVMVEGHSVHRVASLHRKRLVGKSFVAWSPNGRFSEGAKAINGKVFSRIEAVGKNLFAFFDSDGSGNVNKEENPIVLHVHFGMAGNWAVYENEDAPEPSKTNRLRLEYPGIIADLSAMTLKHGGIEMYNEKRSKLGEDPLREDADPERLWNKVQKSSKSIGALIMDQSYFTGPGNIYRAEICFKAGIHPNRLGKTLLRHEFDTIWYHTKDLLERGYFTGSILTVDPEEARALGKPTMRRYIYNTAKCPRCSSSIKSWQIASRTCYACPKCQPLNPNDMETETTKSIVTLAVTPDQDVVPFNSHCAREPVGTRLFESGPSRLTVKELRAELTKRNITFSASAKKPELVQLLSSAMTLPAVSPQTELNSDPAKLTIKQLKALLMERDVNFPSNVKKAALVELLSSSEPKEKKNVVTPQTALNGDPAKLTIKQLKSLLLERNVSFPSNAKKAALVELLSSSEPKQKKNGAKRPLFTSSETAAAEKAVAGESLAVEHIAELAPGQARKARATAIGSKNKTAKEKLPVPEPVSSSNTDGSSNVKTNATRRSKRIRKD